MAYDNPGFLNEGGCPDPFSHQGIQEAVILPISHKFESQTSVPIMPARIGRINPQYRIGISKEVTIQTDINKIWTYPFLILSRMCACMSNIGLRSEQGPL